MGINQYADMTFEEYAKLFKVNKTMEENTNKKLVGIKFKPKVIIKPNATAESLIPSAVDWRDRGAVTRVKDQKLCGSCYAMSTVGALESHNFIQNGKLVELSEQEIIDCAGEFATFQCAGGVSFRVFEYVQAKGLSSAAEYPYEAKGGECRASAKKTAINVKGFGYVDSDENEKTLMRAIAEVGPMAISIDIEHESFMRYSSGIYFDKNCSDKVNHGSLLVGYGSEGGIDYWIVKNSFGESWGENGYVRMARNMGSDCSVKSVALFPVVKKNLLETTPRSTRLEPHHLVSTEIFSKTSTASAEKT